VLLKGRPILSCLTLAVDCQKQPILTIEGLSDGGELTPVQQAFHDSGAMHGFVETPRYPADQYPLATDRVRYVGEEVAAVAATDPYIAEEALGLIQVDYEPLPAVFDPEEAMQLGACEIHPSHPKVEEPFSNIAGKTQTEWGDIDAGFSQSDYVREDRYESHLRTHGYLEPQVTVASFEPSGKLNVWTSSMGPFIKRAKLARTLKLPFSSVRVQKAYVGGAFGGKVDLFSHEYCSARLSMKTGLPVKIEASREEIFTAYRHGQPLIMDIKTGVKKDGTIPFVRPSAVMGPRRSGMHWKRRWT